MAGMSAKEFAAQMQKVILEIKASGTAAILCDNLIAYLGGFIKSPAPAVSAAELEKFKAELQAWVEQQKGIQASRIEMFKSVIMSGQNALKTSFLLNGGAAVALLAFIGKLTDSSKTLIPQFALPLTIFVAGVLTISMTSGFTYLSQWFYAGNKPWKIKTGLVLNIVSIVLGLSSYAIFIWGMCKSYSVFMNFV